MLYFKEKFPVAKNDRYNNRVDLQSECHVGGMFLSKHKPILFVSYLTDEICLLHYVSYGMKALGSTEAVEIWVV